MLVYGDTRRIEDPREKAAAIRRALESWKITILPIERHAIVAGLLVEAGELEQGLLDGPTGGPGQAASRLTRAAAEMLLASFRALSSSSVGEGLAPSREGGKVGSSPPRPSPAREGASPSPTSTEEISAAVARALDDLLACELPATIEVSVPEGYAFYGLYPESYLAAAESALGSLPEGPLRVIGIRSIGTGLAAAVAAVAGPEATVTNVRPTGHPFSRRLALSPRLEQILLADGDSAPRYAIVDEGPGLSGSSFGCVADWLEDHGVAPEAITFFPSHRGEPGPYASERHRERWRRACRPVAEFETLFAAPGSRWPLAGWAADLTGEAVEVEPPLEDLSAGRWREKLVPDRSLWPAADVQGERRKYLLTSQSGHWLLKFAGLGRYGREKLDLSRELDGLIPPVAGLCHGFLVGPWLAEARPLPLVPDLDRRILLAAVAAYLARRAHLKTRERGATVSQLFEMTSYNTGQALGADAAAALEDWRRRLPGIARRERPVLTDNKMHAWEWLVTPEGRILKADALDHHRGNDLVGPQDIAWDLAGAAVELDLDERELDGLASEVSRQSGTPHAERLQLDFYRLAYLAFQTGRHTLAAEALASGTPEEAARMRSAAERYTQHLRQALSVLFFPVGPEARDRLQRRRVIAPEADRAVVHEDVGGRLAVGHLGDPAVEAVRAEPGAGVVRPAGGEDDHPEPLLVEPAQELVRPLPRRIPMLLVPPAGVAVENTVQVDADDGPGIVHDDHFPPVLMRIGDLS